jgi:hypothetical protein
MRAVFPCFAVEGANRPEQQVKSIRTALGRNKTIKTKLIELDARSDVIDEQADHLGEEIKEALSSIEDSMRTARKAKPASAGHAWC